MERLLASQHTNNQLLGAIANMMWGNGGIGPGNTQSAVVGDNTFVTAPYTPQGSNSAQQTQFKVNPDGSVSVNTIPRPDLAANSSQAPTREQVGNSSYTQNTQNQPQANKEESTPSTPNICAQNPNALMCAGLGDADYEDLKPINNNLNVGISYTPYFGGQGTCPKDVEFKFMGATFTFSYFAICQIISRLNPVFQLLGFVSYQGIDLMLTQFVTWMQGQFSKFPVDALNLFYLSGAPSALNWIFSAYAFTATLKATSHLTAQFKR